MLFTKINNINHTTPFSHVQSQLKHKHCSPTGKQLSGYLNQQKRKASGGSSKDKKCDELRGKTNESGYSHGSLPMNCGPGLCWEGGGLGVPTSLFLAILVLALANSNLKVWGISGSNRTPWDQKERVAKCVFLT